MILNDIDIQIYDFIYELWYFKSHVVRILVQMLFESIGNWRGLGKFQFYKLYRKCGK